MMKKKDLAEGRRYKYKKEGSLFYFKILDMINGSIVALLYDRNLSWAHLHVITRSQINEWIDSLTWPTEEEERNLQTMENALQHDGWGMSFRIEE